jgi:hypothetical protein
MSDDDRSHDEPDTRDERIAAMLEVPPLDDLTRRRLVRRALADAAPVPGRRARLLRVAAVVVGVAVVGGAVALVLRDGGGSEEVADRSAGPAETTEAALPAVVPGDLGEISDPGVLRERLEAAREAPPAPDAGRDSGSDTETFEEDTAVVIGLPPTCLDAVAREGAGAPTLVATATSGGVPAFVVVADSSAGETAFVLDQATCTVIRTVPLA